jgi:hypothetical protein
MSKEIECDQETKTFVETLADFILEQCTSQTRSLTKLPHLRVELIVLQWKGCHVTYQRQGDKWVPLLLEITSFRYRRDVVGTWRREP